MKVILTGASGMVGRGVLLECIDHPKVEKVLSIGRTKLDLDHKKLEELIINDFTDYSDVEASLNDYDACFFCLGISAIGKSEEEYRHITYDYTLALAKAVAKVNTNVSFIYVSGAGTDSTEKGRNMWARVKGKVENDLLKMGFSKAFMFRPGAIIPERGIRSKTKAYQFAYDYFMWAIRAVKAIAPNSICTTTQIGKAMINAVLYSYSKEILDPVDIIKLAEESSPN
jgi:uncharacterized protein YbjT (DUF2867 family)